MPTINDFYPSKYIKCADLDGKSKTLTIARVETVVFKNAGKEEAKPLAHFREVPSGLTLNKTNFKAIAAAYGPNTDTWAGERITLSPDRTTFGGREVDTIRVTAPQKEIGQPKAAR
jgi:hypothetical protein